MKCVIFQDDPPCLKILRDTSFGFALLGCRSPHQTWFLHRSVPSITNHLCMLQDCITVAKLVPQPSIMGEYPNFHNCTTAGFKIDWYPTSWKLAKCSQEKFHASLGSLASCVKAPQLYQCSDLQRGLCYHPLGVIFYNYTTKKLRFSRKQVCH